MKLRILFIRIYLGLILALCPSANVLAFAKEIKRCLNQNHLPDNPHDIFTEQKKATDDLMKFLKGETDELPDCSNCYVRVLHGKDQDFDHLVSKGKLGKRKIAFVTDESSLINYRDLKDNPEDLLRSLGYPELSIRQITKAREDLRILVFSAGKSEEIIEGTWLNAMQMIQKEYAETTGEFASLILGVKGRNNFNNLDQVYSTLLKTSKYKSPASIFDLLVNRSAANIQSELNQYGIDLSLGKIYELKKLRTYLNIEVNFNPLYRRDGFVHDPIKNTPTNKEYLIATEKNGTNKLQDRFTNNYDFYPINYINKDLTPELVQIRTQIFQLLNDYDLPKKLRKEIFERLQTKFKPNLYQELRKLMETFPCKN